MMEQVIGDVVDVKFFESVIIVDVYRCGNIILIYCFDVGMLNFMLSNLFLFFNKRGSNFCIGYIIWQCWLVQVWRLIMSWV